MKREDISHDIFVSYAHADRERVRPLVKAIESLGYSVWWDQALAPGSSFVEQTQQALLTAECVVVIWTQAAADSRVVRAEVSLLQQNDKKLMLVLLDLAPPVPGLASTHSVDFTGWDGRPEHPAFPTLIQAIAELAGPPAAGATPVQTEPPPPPTRRVRVPDIAWVEIPGGPFIYQDGETRELPSFWIARYPVTNAQYQTFIDDGGYGDDRWWTDLKRPQPEVSHWPQPNRPCTNVDWYEAVAFTRWLNARLGQPAGTIRLPTEVEWEKAARGERGFAYPWGEEYRSGFANVDETYGEGNGPWFLRQTTAAGLYPHGRSPYDVEDLAGNVLEWCVNKYDDPEAATPDSSGASQAVRGGSWFLNLVNARAVTRTWNRPYDRTVYGGFRLLSSVPIEPVR